MRKLLTVLGALSLVATSSSMVVACKKNDSQDEETGNVFIDANGVLKIDSETVLRWYQENIGIENPTKKLKEFYQLFAVALFQNAKDFETIIPSLTKDQYALEDFKDKLTDLWGKPTDKSPTTIQGAAVDAWNKKEQEAKKEYGEKNYQKKLAESLAKTFPYVNKDYEALKKAWISNEILTNKKFGAEVKLSELLSGNYSPQDTTTFSKTTLLTFFQNAWGNIPLNELKNKILEFVQSLKSEDRPQNEKYLNLINLLNATGGAKLIAQTKVDTPQPWKIQEVLWASTQTEMTQEIIQDLLMRLSNKYDPQNLPTTPIIPAEWTGSNGLVNKWKFYNAKGDKLNNSATYFDLITAQPQPNFVDKKQPSGNQTYGMLTNSQRFIIDQYFKTQKPIALTEIIFKKAENKDLNKIIDGMGFLSPEASQSDSWMQYYGLWNFLQAYVMGGSNAGVDTPISGISQYNFDTIFGNQKKENIGKIRLKDYNISDNPYWNNRYYEAKNDEKLLTLNDKEHSKITKYAIYDFLQAGITESYQLNSKSTPNEPEKIKDENQNYASDGATVAENLKANWGFTDTSIADKIGTDLDNAPETLRSQLIDALYATLHLIQDLNRNSTKNPESNSENQTENKIYQVLNANQGIIAFIDTDGLHITKINAYDVLKKDPTNQTSLVYLADQNAYLNQTENFKNLAAFAEKDQSGDYRYLYQDYQSQIGTATGSVDAFSQLLINQNTISERLPNYGVSFANLNSSVSNLYEKFLINNSIPTANSGANYEANPPFYKFDLLKNAQEAVNESGSDEVQSENSSWLWDYTKTLLQIDESKAMLDRFFEFDSKNPTSNKFKEWLIKTLDIDSKRAVAKSRSNFISGWATWNDEIDNLRSMNEEENKKAPLVKLSWGGDKKTHVEKLMSFKGFLPFLEAETPKQKAWDLVQKQWLWEIKEVSPLKNDENRKNKGDQKWKSF